MKSSNAHPAAEDCEEISELVADYAFGLTDVDASRRVEASLSDCHDVEQELADYRHIQDEMRSSVAIIMPSAQLREKLLAATSSPAVTVKSRSFRISPAWLAAAAAVALLIITNAYWLGRTSGPSSGQTVGDPDSASFVLTGTSGLRWVRLPSEQDASRSAAFLMWNADSRIGLMYAVGMPALATDRVYELWLNREGERVSVGTFVVDNDGEAALLFSSDDPIDNFAWAWITEEPASGSVQPSENIIARGEL